MPIISVHRRDENGKTCAQTNEIHHQLSIHVHTDVCAHIYSRNREYFSERTAADSRGDRNIHVCMIYAPQARIRNASILRQRSLAVSRRLGDNIHQSAFVSMPANISDCVRQSESRLATVNSKVVLSSPSSGARSARLNVLLSRCVRSYSCLTIAACCAYDINIH